MDKVAPILSVLIPTIPDRSDIAEKLYNKVFLQRRELWNLHPTLGMVDIDVREGKSFLNGGLSIGKKRESLAYTAEGKYLCYLDDDENIAPNYLETLVRLCQSDADVITFRSFIKNDFYWGLVDMSLSHPDNEEATPERIIKRKPWHICPVKSEYAKKYKFSDTNYGEDWGWMSLVLYHCKTEAHTDQILHSYQHSTKHSEADKITKYVQSKS